MRDLLFDDQDDQPPPARIDARLVLPPAPDPGLAVLHRLEVWHIAYLEVRKLISIHYGGAGRGKQALDGAGYSDCPYMLLTIGNTLESYEFDALDAFTERGETTWDIVRLCLTDLARRKCIPTGDYLIDHG